LHIFINKEAKMKKILLSLFLVTFFSSFIFAEDLTGFYQTIDKKTKLPTSVIAVYFYQGKYYGRIIACCNKQGRVAETIEHPESRAEGITGKPYYCGIDFIWSCAPDKGCFKGIVFDPREGKKYTAKIWKENGNLILRGEVLCFGRNEVLRPFPKENFNEFFVKPNLNNFVPIHCKIK
jgi:uncharacterized protein (DUF2147 family)